MKSISERFWEKVELIPFHECWEWNGSKVSGYGHFMVDGKITRAHRYSLQIHNIEVPKHLVVMHKCDNRGCVNPKHLSVGTHKDNNLDSINKRRQCQVKKVACVRGHPFDSNNTRYRMNLKSGNLYRRCITCLKLHNDKRIRS